MFTDLTLGSDVVNIARVEKAYDQFGLRFFERFLTPQEWQYCMSLGEAMLEKPNERRRFLRRSSSRIAAKEATAKALSVGIKGMGQWGGTIRWKEVEIQTAQPRQGPQIILHGRAQDLAEYHGITRWKLSLTHDAGIAIATVIGLIEA